MYWITEKFARLIRVSPTHLEGIEPHIDELLTTPVAMGTIPTDEISALVWEDADGNQMD